MLWIKSAVDRNHLEKREGRRCCEYSDQQLHADASAVHGISLEQAGLYFK